jgi:hypothetical protein
MATELAPAMVHLAHGALASIPSGEGALEESRMSERWFDALPLVQSSRPAA